MAHALRRSRWIAAAISVGGVLWRLAERLGNVDYLIGISESPIIRSLASNADYILIILGVSLSLLVLKPDFFEAVSRGVLEAQRRWKTRRWTDAGLNWAIRPESHKLLRDGRMLATLTISPVPNSELPQPLDIIITCAGRIAEVSSKFYADASQAREASGSGDVEIPSPSAEKEVSLRLYSPKLLPPACWDLTLVSAGNAEVKVVNVRRAPRKGVAPTRPKPPADPAPPKASEQAPP